MSEKKPDTASHEQIKQNVEVEELPVVGTQQDDVKGGSGSNTWAGNIILH